MDNKYKVTYFNDITKSDGTKIVYATTKRKARSKFNNMWHNPYPILSIVEIKE